MFKLLKCFLICLFLSFSFSSKSAELQPKAIIAVGGFASKDDALSDNIGKQTVKHFRDVYIGLSIYNRLAFYTNETFLNKGYKVNYNIQNTVVELDTQVYTTGVMYEFYQDKVGNHEYGLGLSFNRNRRYINNDVSSNLKYNSTCAEALYNYTPKDVGFRFALCPRLWTTEKDNVLNIGYIDIYKRF